MTLDEICDAMGDRFSAKLVQTYASFMVFESTYARFIVDRTGDKVIVYSYCAELKIDQKKA